MERTPVHRVVSHRRSAAIEAVDAGTATFNEWFVAQFGDPQFATSLKEAKRELAAHEASAAEWRAAIAEMESRLLLRDAALKAWTAREDLIRRNLAAQGSL